MKELWVKKTIWRRYLIDDGDLEEAQQILAFDDRGDEIVADCLDKNEKVEYDNEAVIRPVEYSIDGDTSIFATEPEIIAVKHEKAPN